MPVDVESPSIEVSTSVALKLALARIVDGISTVTPTRKHKCMKVSDRDLVHFPIVKDAESEYPVSVVLLVFSPNAQGAIQIRASLLELVEATLPRSVD